MDITLAKTFLAIIEVGNFAKAAEQLYVTQSTISTRIKQLEGFLGQSLFVRTKSGTTLTPAGAQFKPFAEKMLQTWEQACQEVALPQNFEARLSVGGAVYFVGKVDGQMATLDQTGGPGLRHLGRCGGI